MTQDDFKTVSALVTGGAGFIGSHLVDALVAAGARVRVLDSFATGRRENLAASSEHIEVLAADIRDEAACQRACEGVDLVFHQAALGSVPRSLSDPATSMAVNIQGTGNLFAAAQKAGVRRVVYASSSSVYGDSDRLPKREGQEGEPLSPYALTKRVNEQQAAVFARCYDMELIGLRYFNVYGPRQDPRGAYAAVIPRFFATCVQGQAPVIHGDGQQSRDFTYVGDVVQANLQAARAIGESCGRVYNIAAGRRTTILDLAHHIRRIVGRGLEPQHDPPRPGDVQHSLADISRARNGLDFKAQTSLEDGLTMTRDHFG